MDASKISLTERLRAEGRWAEASRFKDEAVKRLRASGMKRSEAREQAWEEMAEAYPPIDPEAQVVSEVTQWVCKAAGEEVDRWVEQHGITLPDGARESLIGEKLAYFWALGLTHEIPGHACSDDSDTVDVSFE